MCASQQLLLPLDVMQDSVSSTAKGQFVHIRTPSCLMLVRRESRSKVMKMDIASVHHSMDTMINMALLYLLEGIMPGKEMDRARALAPQHGHNERLC